MKGSDAPHEAVTRAADRMLEIVSGFYLNYGVGMFGLNRAFRLAENTGKELTFVPINKIIPKRFVFRIWWDMRCRSRS